jgi:hypothetical protein
MNRRLFLTSLLSPIVAPVAKLLPQPKPKSVFWFDFKKIQSKIRVTGEYIVGSNIIMKSRQCGMTTLSTALIQYRAGFYK